MKKTLIAPVVISALSLAAIGTLIAVTQGKGKGACPGSCAGCGLCGTKPGGSYYALKEEKLKKALNGRKAVFNNALKAKYDKEQIDLIMERAEQLFSSLIPDIPYIGGDGNEMTEDIENAAMALAFYRAMGERGATVEEVGGVITESVRMELEKYPRFFTRMLGAKYFSKKNIDSVRASAARSQEREYEGAWVTRFVEGDGATFDYGYDHVECGIVKYLRAQGADELTPYLCSLDFIYSDALGEGLRRTKTIAHGDGVCDFRWKRE